MDQLRAASEESRGAALRASAAKLLKKEETIAAVASDLDDTWRELNATKDELKSVLLKPYLLRCFCFFMFLLLTNAGTRWL